MLLDTFNERLLVYIRAICCHNHIAAVAPSLDPRVACRWTSWELWKQASNIHLLACSHEAAKVFAVEVSKYCCLVASFVVGV